VPISPYLGNSVFDPAVVRSMGAAFESACRVMEAANIPRSREEIAKRIITAAATGERDPERLRDMALREFGFHR
jgi:hypothetical protein